MRLATAGNHPASNNETAMNISKTLPCACGESHLELNFRDGMPAEVVDRVFCPRCRQNGMSTEQSFPIRGGWYLHFNLEVARMFAMARLNIDPSLVNPGFILDGRYVEPARNE
jgi:hypothetical protein